MFTGIVEELGQVKALSLRGNSGTLTVKAKKFWKEQKSVTASRSMVSALRSRI